LYACMYTYAVVDLRVLVCYCSCLVVVVCCSAIID